MYSEITGAFAGLKAASDIALAITKLHTMTEVQGKAIELQSIILKVQSDALDAQAQQGQLAAQVSDLKAEIATLKAWDVQKQRYAMRPACETAVVYALKRAQADSEPPHWICATCYDDGKKGILFDKTNSDSKGQRQRLVLECPRCKNQIDSGYAGGRVERHYAEDIA